jgi:hypothetical protein
MRTTVRELEDSYYGTGRGRQIDIDEENFNPLVTDPLLDGLCFFFAAFGILEIALDLPRNETFAYRSKDWLTPFEGVRAVRLTPIGAYLFGRTSELELEVAKVQRTILHFHPERLHLRVENPDPVTQPTLDEHLERLGPNHYQLTRASIIGDATTVKDIQARVRRFNTQLGSELPENWKSFTAALESEPAALEKQNKVRVFKLSDAPGLRKAFTFDPTLRELCARAENWQIIVEEAKVAQLKKRLQALGFICE